MDMLLHIDGARLPNACSFLNCDLSKLCNKADMISFGGTKSGLLMAEVAIIKESAEWVGGKRIPKQLGQLISKQRFVAAQYKAYLKNNLYIKFAKHSHQMALKLFQSLSDVFDDKMTLIHPIESNAVFFRLLETNNQIESFLSPYSWEMLDSPIYRLMTNSESSRQNIEQFIATLMI
ncbi:MAG: beta-eliminating lyase-related protein [Bdellovibrionota bacterium]